jgi:HAD superfamily hydrolase (TIGR01509 family)
VAGACLVLDFDGTVLDTEEPVYVSWAELWREHGHELAVKRWQALIGTDDGFDPLVELESRLGRRLDPEVRHRVQARREELQQRHDVRPGVLSWLAQADRLAVPVGIASSSPPEWVEAHLERLGLRDRFACLVCRDELVPPKPDPTSYRLACEGMGADPALSVAVEDSPHGVVAATSAGLYTVAVPHELTADLDLSGADVLVESLDALALSDALASALRRN